MMRNRGIGLAGLDEIRNFKKKNLNKTGIKTRSKRKRDITGMPDFNEDYDKEQQGKRQKAALKELKGSFKIAKPRGCYKRKAYTVPAKTICPKHRGPVATAHLP
jgi:prephenate dehydratase